MNPFARRVRRIKNIPQAKVIADVDACAVFYLMRTIEFERIKEPVQRIREEAEKIHHTGNVPPLFVDGEVQTVLFRPFLLIFFSAFLFFAQLFELFFRQFGR